MSKRVLLASIEMGCGYHRGIYHFSRSLIHAINKKYELGLLTHAYQANNYDILESLNELNCYFYKKYKIKNRWRHYLRYIFSIQGGFEVVQNNHLFNDNNDCLKLINFFVNKPVFYYYNNQYLKLPGLRLHNLEISSLNSSDVIFTSSPLNIRSKKHSVIQTLHDVFPLISNDYYQIDFQRKIYGLTAADKIMAVSNYAKESFLKYYPDLENRIEVVYQSVAIDDNLIEKSNNQHLCELILTKYNLRPKKYMFFVGAIEYRKNIHNLVQAYKIAMKGNDELKLVIAGRADDPKYLNNFGLLRYMQDDNSENIQFIGEISNFEKVCLIKNSRAFLFPSLLEGFGIPVVESQTLGVPVLTSNNSALTEVAGDSAFLVENPENLDELADGIRQLWNDDELCFDLINKGFENIKRFTFDTFSDNVNRIIDSV